MIAPAPTRAQEAVPVIHRSGGSDVRGPTAVRSRMVARGAYCRNSKPSSLFVRRANPADLVRASRCSPGFQTRIARARAGAVSQQQRTRRRSRRRTRSVRAGSALLPTPRAALEQSSARSGSGICEPGAGRLRPCSSVRLTVRLGTGLRPARTPIWCPPAPSSGANHVGPVPFFPDDFAQRGAGGAAPTAKDPLPRRFDRQVSVAGQRIDLGNSTPVASRLCWMVYCSQIHLGRHLVSSTLGGTAEAESRRVGPRMVQDRVQERPMKAVPQHLSVATCTDGALVPFVARSSPNESNQVNSTEVGVVVKSMATSASSQPPPHGEPG